MVVKTKTLILFGLLFCFLITNISALTFSKYSETDIKHEVRLDGAIPPATTLCNISIYYPNNSLLIDFTNMTNHGDYFSYPLNSTHTSVRGDYTYCITCSGGNNNATDCFDFIINLGGVEPSQLRTDSSTRTIYVFFGLGLLAFLGFFLTKKVPIRATLFLFMVWFFLMGINATYISMQDEIMNSSLENFFSFFLTISIHANYFIFLSIGILWTTTFIVNLFEGHKKKIEEERY